MSDEIHNCLFTRNSQRRFEETAVSLYRQKNALERWRRRTSRKSIDSNAPSEGGSRPHLAVGAAPDSVLYEVLKNIHILQRGVSNAILPNRFKCIFYK